MLIAETFHFWVTRLNAWRIVVAKWGSLVLQALLLLVAVMYVRPQGLLGRKEERAV